jgi:hypothetical protein
MLRSTPCRIGAREESRASVTHGAHISHSSAQPIPRCHGNTPPQVPCGLRRPDRARALCQKLLSFAGPLLLYAEEIDTTTGEHLGNFPQAFTHLALIEAVSLLIASELEEDVKSAGWDPAASTQVRSG